jgi:PAS domain S-box
MDNSPSLPQSIGKRDYNDRNRDRYRCRRRRFFTRPPMCNEDILKHLSEGIAFVDPAGIIVYWNRGAENLLGIPASEACGRPVWEVQWRLLPEDARTHDALSGIEKSVKNLLNVAGSQKRMS